ncbi:adenylyl-sulfate kinase [Coprobacter sp. LH1063]|uniref:Adenylyl-sulfate kinase n=2 Tax=Coprobacter tertius TaxID=2944915 RepID=A0ABT1MJP0_9BACT|nr:adenylyl-sulfate kinase [Coprobacter tertius]MCP9612838.1 adenylyl-sulfate kinase [Coprobacter tertius]
MIMKNNIYPIFDKMLQRSDKEQLLKQHSVMIWFTGLSGSGKSTLAIALERELHRRGLLCRILDGDNIRSGINNNLGFSPEDRIENIRRIAEVSKLFVDSGIITIAAFISPSNEMRKLASDIIGKDDFIEVFIDTPLEVCEERDVKGLYAKARRGEIKEFTGISAPFEQPEHPDLRLDTSKLEIGDSVKKLLELILPKVKPETTNN